MSTPIAPPPANERLDDGQRSGSRRRSVARLAAVQALYQLELNRGVDPETVVHEFARHRFGHEVDGGQYGEADPPPFSHIVCGGAAGPERLQTKVSAGLT